MNFGSVAKALIEKVGSDVLQTKVTLSSVDISLSDQSVALKGLKIANPQGFKSPYL